MPGVVTNSRFRPSSLKKPLSRATSTGRSCTAFMIATWGFVEVSWMAMAFSYTDRRDCAMRGIPPMILPVPACVNALAAIALEPVGGGERIPEPCGGKIVTDNLPQRLEDFEAVLPFRDPEHDRGLHWRAARHGAGELPDVDVRVGRQLEALARPPLHPVERVQALRAFSDGSEHRVSVSDA